ncbi:flavin reductase, partial [Streptomyces sp. McG8]|uniref:flavin reductase n=1 Tax=Streptomyces sp. McG8 TaxID=2725487 RepID=UPI001BE65FB4|nr:flavin reductase family protein [Streptomyces sp. McG8]
CRLHERHRAGDHTIMIGRVNGVRLAPGEPLVYYDRAFHTVTAVGGFVTAAAPPVLRS